MEYFENWNCGRFSLWEKSAKSTLDAIFNCVLDVVTGETVREKRRAIEYFALHATQHIKRNWNPMIDRRSFKFVPAKQIPKDFLSDDSFWLKNIETNESLPVKAEDPTALLWFSAQELGESIAKAPQRLKFCEYCYCLFWDSITKPGNMRICGKPSCKRAWGAKRTKQSYDNLKRKKKRIRKAVLKKKRNAKA